MSTDKSSTTRAKWAAEAQVQGWTWLSKVDVANSLYQCNTCGSEQKLRVGRVRDGLVKCETCQLRKYQSEAETQGWKFHKRVKFAGGLYRHSCGHEQEHQMTTMRKGLIKCANCQQKRYESEANSQGWEFQKNIDGDTGLYQHFCGHDQEINIGAMRKGSITCHGCGESWATKPSNAYLLRITADDVSFLKLGIAKDVGVRTTTYGLPDRAAVEIVRTIAYPTGKEAVKHEKRIHRTIVDHSAVTRFDASYWMENGHTECYVYSMEAENALSHAMFVESTRKKAIGF